MNRFDKLKVYQKCGTLALKYNPIAKQFVIESTIKISVLLESRRRTIHVYGLGDCRDFIYKETRYQHIIENSTVEERNGELYENKICRSRFTKPALVVRLPACDVRLSAIEMNGVMTLNSVLPSWIDEEARVFHMVLQHQARLNCSLPVTHLLCTMGGRAAITTAKDLPNMSRAAWVLTEFNLIVEKNSRITADGIHVIERLEVILAPDSFSNIVGVTYEPECVVTNPPITSIGDQIQLMGRAPEPQGHYITNANGMVVYVREPEPFVPQEILDASRAEYERQECAPSSVAPCFPVVGNAKLEDVVATGAEPTCMVCLTNKAVAVLAGCGHVATCVDCTKELSYRTEACPMCRAPITSAIIPFISIQ